MLCLVTVISVRTNVDVAFPLRLVLLMQTCCSLSGLVYVALTGGGLWANTMQLSILFGGLLMIRNRVSVTRRWNWLVASLAVTRVVTVLDGARLG